MGIKFSDIIALAKSGYTVSDVKELMQLSETPSNNDETKAPQNKPEPPAPAPPDPPPQNKPEPPAPAPPDPPPQAPEPPAPAPPEQEEVDYKTLYEQEQEKVKRLQAVNRNQNAQTTEKTDQEILMDLARDFM